MNKEQMLQVERNDLSNQAMIESVLAFQQQMMLYESAAKYIVTKVGIWQEEYRTRGVHVPIESCKSRIKHPVSIAKKLAKKGKEINLEAIDENINDIAGVRIVCPYIRDVYTVRNCLLSQQDIFLVEEKDYIQHPKANGYRSLHLIIEVEVPLSDSTELVRAEIQLRTISMDSWATLEHQLRYKEQHHLMDETINEELKSCAQLLYLSDCKMQQIAENLNVFDDVCDRGTGLLSHERDCNPVPLSPLSRPSPDIAYYSTFPKSVEK